MVAITYGLARSALAAANTNAAGKGIFARVLGALMEARMRQAQREIDMYTRLSRSWKHEIDAVTRDDLPFGSN